MKQRLIFGANAKASEETKKRERAVVTPGIKHCRGEEEKSASFPRPLWALQACDFEEEENAQAAAAPASSSPHSYFSPCFFSRDGKSGGSTINSDIQTSSLFSSFGDPSSAVSSGRRAPRAHTHNFTLVATIVCVGLKRLGAILKKRSFPLFPLPSLSLSSLLCDKTVTFHNDILGA